MSAEPGEQFHFSQNLEVTLVRYLSCLYAERGEISDDAARESIYIQSLNGLHDMVTSIQSDPRKSDEIIRGVMPPRFDENRKDDVGLWLTELQLAPTKLIQRGDITIDSEDINIKFFDELLSWTVACSEGHTAKCSFTKECLHDLASHQELCPVRETGFTLMAEIRLLYYKLHGEYQAYALANKIDFMRERAEAIGQLFVKHGFGKQDDLEAFLLRAENDAIVYASKVNGLDSVTDDTSG